MERPLSTMQVARAAGCSAQQVRDLEAAGVIPPSVRAANGYRRFGAVHVTAVHVYRDLAAAVGPTVARDVLAHLATDPHDAALARISALHGTLAHERGEVLHALTAVAAIRAERERPVPADAEEGSSTMTITELGGALGVRPSTLRFWELQDLVHPERHGRTAARVYSTRSIREARIVAALRASGHGIPATAQVMSELREQGGVEALHSTLQARRADIARRMELLLRAGTSLVELRAELRGG